MFSSIALSVVLVLAGPSQLLSNPEAQAKLKDAQQAFKDEDFDAAAAAVEAAYLIEPHPMLLYPWAQAERSRGNCQAAVELYQRFIESGPAEQLATAAQENLDRCKEQLADESEADEVEDEVVEDEVIEDEGDEDLEPDPAPIPVEPVRKDDEPKTKAWYKDVLGGVLSGVGVAGVGAGVGLLAVGSSTAKKASDVDMHTDYLAERDRATSLRNGGAIAASIGGALLIGGVVRYLLVAKKNKSSATAWQMAPGLGPQWTGVSIGRRF